MEIVDPLAQEHVGVSVPPMLYLKLVSPIHENLICVEEERCEDEINFIHEPSSYSLDRYDSLMEDVVSIDSRVVDYGNIIEYRARESTFSPIERVTLMILSLQYSVEMRELDCFKRVQFP